MFLHESFSFAQLCSLGAGFLLLSFVAPLLPNPLVMSWEEHDEHNGQKRLTGGQKLRCLLVLAFARLNAAWVQANRVVKTPWSALSWTALVRPTTDERDWADALRASACGWCSQSHGVALPPQLQATANVLSPCLGLRGGGTLRL